MIVCEWCFARPVSGYQKVLLVLTALQTKPPARPEPSAGTCRWELSMPWGSSVGPSSVLQKRVREAQKLMKPVLLGGKYLLCGTEGA